MTWQRCIALALCLLLVHFDINAEQPDYLSDEWGADFEITSLGQEQHTSLKDEQRFIDALAAQTSLKIKTDLAYADELSMARGHGRLNSALRPFDKAYLKLDVQYNVYHAEDNLVEGIDSTRHHMKLNDLWFQYTHEACNAKAGRQKLFWGAVEGSYALDNLMPLDLTEPLLTDFSLIRRSQDMLVLNCFGETYDVELMLTPEPLLDQLTVRQQGPLKSLEEELEAEWGARVTAHFPGIDVALYVARLFENTPQMTIDFFTFGVSGYHVDQYDLVGLSVIYAMDKLMLEMDLSYQEERLSKSVGITMQDDLLKYRTELALGFEYTTDSNHQLSAGGWFYNYVSPLSPFQIIYNQVWNFSWSKQYLNDDLTLSTLLLWQKHPDITQLTAMADYLWDDQWSSAFALGYQALASSAAQSGSPQLSRQGWTSNLSLSYQF